LAKVPAPGPTSAKIKAPKPPPDPVAKGNCSLKISLFDFDTGAAASLAVQLWRLDAPGDETWTKGDRLYTRAEVGAKGATIPGLPEGTYRLACLAQRAGAEDPPAFPVQGPLTEVRFGLWMPRKSYVRLRLVDERGVPVKSARVFRWGSSWSLRSSRPAWVRPRRLRHPPPAGTDSVIGIGRGAGGLLSGIVNTGNPIPQPPEGYHVGPIRESSHAYRRQELFLTHCEGYTSVRLTVSGDEISDRTYLGVIVPVAPLLAHISLPNGTSAAEAGARLSAGSRALLLGPDTPADYWLHVPIKVTVQLFGYRPLTFEWRPGEAQPDRVLRPK